MDASPFLPAHLYAHALLCHGFDKSCLPFYTTLRVKHGCLEKFLKIYMLTKLNQHLLKSNQNIL